MALKFDSIPTYLDEFRNLKLDHMIRDVKKLNNEELKTIKKEIEKLLFYEEVNA